MKNHHLLPIFILIAACMVPSAFADTPLTGDAIISDNGGHGLAIADGPSGVSLSFYRSGGTLAYAEKSGGGYSVEDIDVGAGGVNPPIEAETALSFLGESPHIFYRDDTPGDLLHAYKNGLNWETEIVDSDGGFPSSAPCGDSLCVCYKDLNNDNLKFAEGTTSNWSTETIDGSANDVGDFCFLLAHSSGEIYVAYYDRTAKVAKIAKRSSGVWTTESLAAPGDAEWGYWPHLLELEDGAIELRSTGTKTTDTSSSDPQYYYSKKTSGENWSSVWASGDSYVGGYPTAALIDDRVISFFRYLRFSALFGDAGFIKTNEELEDNSTLSGNLGVVAGCLLRIRYMSSLFSTDRKVVLAYLREATGCGIPDSSIMLYESDAIEGSTPSPTPTATPTGSGGGEATPTPGPSGPSETSTLKEAVQSGKSLLKEIKGNSSDSSEAEESLQELITQLDESLLDSDYTKKVARKVKQASKLLTKLLNAAEQARNGNKKQKRKVKSFKKKASKALNVLKKKL